MVLVDKGAVCNLHVHAGEPNENVEEVVHRNHHKSQSRVARHLGVPHEWLEVSQDGAPEKHSDPVNDEVESQ